MLRLLWLVSLVVLALASSASAAPPRLPISNDELIRRLILNLKDADPDIRQNLAQALAKIGASAVEPLIEALRDPLPERRAGAAYALGLIGSPARNALEPLLDALADKDLDVRRQAAYAVNRLVPQNRPPTPVARAQRNRGE